MRELIIEYVTEGRRRGYTFVSPTRGLDDAALKRVWQSAMPRGQGWGADLYRGARSLKCFPLDERTLALSEVSVTDQRDESGRGGIRRALIRLMPHDDGLDYLTHLLHSYPETIQAQIAKKPTIGQWKRIIDRTLPKVRGEAQVILAYPYTTADDWQAAEAVVLKIAVSRRTPVKRWGKIPPFTTLALDYREESRIVALPAQQLIPANDVPYIEI